MVRRVLTCLVLVGALSSGNAGNAWDPFDGEEMQRCVWRCLANAAQGASDPAYQACIERVCVAEDNAARQRGAWTTGTTADGGGHYARTSDVGRGTDFMFMCSQPGQIILALSGINEKWAAMTLDIDGTQFGLAVAATEGSTQFVRLGQQNNVLAALFAGTSLRVLDYDGQNVGSFILAGAAKAIQQVQAACN